MILTINTKNSYHENMKLSTSYSFIADILLQDLLEHTLNNVKCTQTKNVLKRLSAIKFQIYQFLT